MRRAKRAFRQRQRHLVDFTDLLIDDRHEPAGPIPVGHRGAVRDVARKLHRIVARGGITRQVHAFVIVQDLFAVGERKIIMGHDETSSEDDNCGRLGERERERERERNGSRWIDYNS
jgi:hypothetical protein